MRYQCICCAATGADGNRIEATEGPYAYNCHVCLKHKTMWPEPQAKKYFDTVIALQQPRGNNEADRLVIGQLQTDINVLKAVIKRQQALLNDAVEIVDAVLPQAANLTLSWGQVNDFLCAARPKR